MFANFREFFLKQSIHKQIKLGIILTNTFVCVLVLTLISINAYIILSINYHNLVHIIDNKEDEFLDSAGIFIAIESYIVIEGTKEPLSWTRSLLEVLQKNQDFINNFKAIDYESKLIPFESIANSGDCLKSLSDCIALRQYRQATDLEVTGYQILKQAMFWMIPFYQELFNFRHFRSNDSPLYYKISLYSRKYNCVFFYPVTGIGYKQKSYFNSNFNETTFKKKLLDYKVSTSERLLIAIDHSFINVNTSDIYNTVLNNPNTRFVPFSQEEKPFDVDPSLTTGLAVSTTNTKYNENLKPLLNLTNTGVEDFRSIDENLKFVDDVIIADWSGTGLDKFTFDLTTQFEGFNLIAVNPLNESTFSTLNCLIQSTEFEMLNKLTNYGTRRKVGRDHSISFQPVLSYQCIRYPEGISNFMSAFVDIQLEELQLIRRKKVIKLFNNYVDISNENITNYNQAIMNYPNNTKELGYNDDDGQYYKIFKLYQPDIFTQTMIQSYYLNNYFLAVYVYKNTRFIIRDSYIILMRIYGGFIIVFLYSFLIWVAEIIVMTLVLHKVSSSLTLPIDTLTIHVRNIGQDKIRSHLGINKTIKNKNATDESLVELENLNYPDDDDINQLFSICKSMVKGGFSEDKKYFKKDYSVEAENDINQLKVNNLIIDEFIINHYGLSSSNHIFTYKGNQIEERVKMFRFDHDNEEMGRRVSRRNVKINKIIKEVLFKKSTHTSLKNPVAIFSGDGGLTNNSTWKSKQNINMLQNNAITKIVSDISFKYFKCEKNLTIEKAIKKDVSSINIGKQEKVKLSLLDIHNKIKNKFEKDIHSVKL